VIRHGIEMNTEYDLTMIPMRHGVDFNGVRQWDFGDWNMGRDDFIPYSGRGWATNFTNFRWSIPEVCGFSGRAIYLDADQTVHDDIAELMYCPLQGLPCAIRTGVIVFDCSHPFWESSKWVSLDKMKSSGWRLGDFQKRIPHCKFDVAWDVLDGKEMSPREAKLNHYTAMQWQPYHPFPDRFSYPERHPVPDVDQVWWESYFNALGGINLPGDFDSLVSECLAIESGRGLDSFGREDGFEFFFTDRDRFESDAKARNPNGWRGVVRR